MVVGEAIADDGDDIDMDEEMRVQELVRLESVRVLKPDLDRRRVVRNPKR